MRNLFKIAEGEEDVWQIVVQLEDILWELEIFADLI